jgi:hypothetical protein
MKATLTQRKLSEILKENTGSHMLDSGGAYGRHWQRNRTRDFLNENDCTLKFEYDYINLTVNLFHWLDNILTYDVSMNRRFSNNVRRNDDKNLSWFAEIDSFFAYLGKHEPDLTFGIYPDEQTTPYPINSYNSENNLSQDILFTIFHIDYESYVCLQIHNGCDARGGYTSPMFFTFKNDPADIVRFSDASIFCNTNREHNWYTDDSSHWYLDGSCSSSTKHLQLENIPHVDIEELDSVIIHTVPAGQYMIDGTMLQENYNVRIQADSPSGDSDLVIPIDDDSQGYCPLCWQEKATLSPLYGVSY